ncbi:hypothetical protein R3Q06_31960 [Rhodococcus erythropolis]|uniref:hypothetical protein n=1 Tax=Rhodococcus erythropolis TaxID=1833 RepID=UPI002948E3E8|nr:hypothetical protein [Rhodococcus erythropolis]MDV6278094.1 hypothetical protein [Rhodococcus erythropolis]
MIDSSASVNASTLAAVERLASSVRVRRRVASTNLLVFGAGILAVGVGGILDDATAPQSGDSALVVPLALCLVWVVTSIRAHRSGVHGYRVGYAAVAGVSVVSLLFGLVPFSAVVGSVTLLGVGFLILGWRERSRPVWITAAVGIVIGSLTAGQSLRQAMGIADDSASNMLSTFFTAAFGVVVLAVGAWMFLAESREVKNLVG